VLHSREGETPQEAALRVATSLSFLPSWNLNRE
jgi:hypothetical protein